MLHPKLCSINCVHESMTLIGAANALALLYGLRINWISLSCLQFMFEKFCHVGGRGELSIRPWKTKFKETLIRTQQFSCKKMYLYLSPAKRWLFCSGLNLLTPCVPGEHQDVWPDLRQGCSADHNCGATHPAEGRPGESGGWGPGHRVSTECYGFDKNSNSSRKTQTYLLSNLYNIRRTKS